MQNVGDFLHRIKDPIGILCKGPPAANQWNVGENKGMDGFL